MILLGLLLLCLILVLVGALVRGGFSFVDFFVFPSGRSPRRVARWLWLLLAATLLGVIVHLQHLP